VQGVPVLGEHGQEFGSAAGKVGGPGKQFASGDDVRVHAVHHTVRCMAMYSIASILAGQRCPTVINMAQPPVFDADSQVPLYIQAADYVAARIASGDLVAGARLPAERDLAEQWGIAYQTVRRTMRELRERGLVASVIGKGTFVSRQR
jgi:GntR family transcriptional regulator